MKVVDISIEGDYHVYEDTDIETNITGNLYIHQGVYCIFNGSVDGNVYIYKDALVEVNGIIDNDLFSYGGDIIIGGLFKGYIYIYPHEL